MRLSPSDHVLISRRFIIAMLIASILLIAWGAVRGYAALEDGRIGAVIPNAISFFCGIFVLVTQLRLLARR